MGGRLEKGREAVLPTEVARLSLTPKSAIRRSGVAQLAEQRPVKPFVVGSSPTPGAKEAEVLSLSPPFRRSALFAP